MCEGRALGGASSWRGTQPFLSAAQGSAQPSTNSSGPAMACQPVVGLLWRSVGVVHALHTVSVAAVRKARVVENLSISFRHGLPSLLSVGLRPHLMGIISEGCHLCPRRPACSPTLSSHRRSRPLAQSCRQNNGFWSIAEMLLNISRSANGAWTICLRMGNCARGESALGSSSRSQSYIGTHASTISALRANESVRGIRTKVSQKYPSS